MSMFFCKRYVGFGKVDCFGVWDMYMVRWIVINFFLGSFARRKIFYFFIIN
jgi:hypothetical protein